jgi:ATP-dependent DNA helicase RecG
LRKQSICYLPNTSKCALAGLPKPLLTYNGGADFWVIFRKDIYHVEYLDELGLNERQIKAALYTKEKGKISNKDYQELNHISDRTASRDLEKLHSIGVLRRIGDKKGAHYELGGYGG